MNNNAPSHAALNRRGLLHSAVTAAATLAATDTPAEAFDGDDPEVAFVDTNVSLFRWPFRRLPLDETPRLVARLRQLGIGEAWASSFEGLLHRDLAAVNERLSQECKLHRELVPIGVIHPKLPGWEDDWRQCFERHAMPGIRVYPGYHGYDLSDAAFGQLLRLATRTGQFIQLVTALEDTRTQHPLVQVKDVDLAPLNDWIDKIDGVRIELLGHRARGNSLAALADLDPVTFETSRVDGTDTIANLIGQMGVSRVLFGSHAPFLIPEAALIRVYESQLNDEHLLSVMRSSADAFRRG